MALRGTLENFRTSDLLQFLIHSRKSGTLRAFDDDDTKYLLFRDGQIVYAMHERQVPRVEELVQHNVLGANGGADDAGSQRWAEVLSGTLKRRRELSSELQSTSVVEEDLTHVDAQLTFARLKSLTEGDRSTIRLGEYLAATGRITRRDLEKALEQQLRSEKLLGEILVDQNALSSEDLLEAVDQISDLRNAFGPLHALSEALAEIGALDATDFAEAVSEHETSGQFLWDVLVASGTVTEQQMDKAVRRVLVSELCDLFLWSDGAFEFAEDFFLEDPFENNGLPRVLGRSYDLQTLLLNAHSSLDELRRAGLEDFSLDTIFERVEPEEREPLRENSADGPDRKEHNSGKAAADKNVTRHDARPADAKAADAKAADAKANNGETARAAESTGEAAAESGPGTTEARASTEATPTAAGQVARTSEPARQADKNVAADTATTTAAPEADRDQEAETIDDVILRSLDGRYCLREVRRVLPGNRFDHFCQFARLLSDGVIRILTREEANRRGGEAAAQERYKEALVFFRHALAVAGDEPSNTQIRGKIQEVSRFVQDNGSAGGTTTPIRGRGILMSARMRVAAEKALIRTGLARPFWSAYTRLPRPVRKAVSRWPIHLVGTAAAIWIIFVCIELFFSAPGRSEPARVEAASSSRVEEQPHVQAMRVAPLLSSQHATGAPVETAPVLAGASIFFTARDGVLRALRVTGLDDDQSTDATLKLDWECQIGEFGDLLSAPLLADDKLFLCNVRGFVVAVSLSGQPLWTKQLGRTETLTPRPVFVSTAQGAQARLAGLVVASREKVVVLSPVDGAILYEYQTGNRIRAHPEVVGTRVIVGSADDHLYCLDLQTHALVWEHETRDDIVATRVAADVVVFATRDGLVAALRATTGEPLWTREPDGVVPDRLRGASSSSVYLLESDGALSIVDPQTGELQESCKPSAGSILSVERDRILCFLAEGSIGELDRSGTLRWKGQAFGRDVLAWAESDSGLVVSSRDGVITFVSVPSPDSAVLPTHDE